MPTLRADRTEPLSLTGDSLNTGVTFAVDFAGDDGVPYVGVNSPTKVGTLPLITTSVGTNSGRDVSNGGTSGINQYRWDDATKIGIPSGVADFTFWARLRTPNVANSTPDQKELIRITNGTTTLLQIFQYELNNSFAGYAVHVVRNGSTTLITYSDTGTIIAPNTVYDVHISRTAAGAFKIYVDGVLRKTGTGFTADFTIVTGSGFSFFGAVNHGTRNAALIDAMTWSRQLSDSEVTSHQADPYSYQTHSSPAVTGTASWTEANDTAAGSGSLAVSGTSSTTEANDTASGVGTVGNVVNGNASWTEANDTASASGSLSISGTSATTEANDAASGSGTVASGGTFIAGPIMNNTETIMANQAVYWTWTASGRIGAMSGKTVTDGTGTTASDGRLTVTGLSAGSGILMVARRVTSAADDDVYYQAGTVS